jgi:hypothetical protein
VVSEAFGGAVDASATSSYRLAGGTLTPVSTSVPTTETAACWAVVTRNGQYAYVTNAGSGTVSGYSVGSDGSLTLLDADGVTGSAWQLHDAAVTANNYPQSDRGSTRITRSRSARRQPVGERRQRLPAGAVGFAAR